MKRILIFLALALSALPLSAQELVEDRIQTVKARVTDVIEERRETIPGTDTPHEIQRMRAEILQGPSKGNQVEFENDYVKLEEGETFYLRIVTPWEGGSELYSVAEPYRSPFLLFLTLLFIAITLLFGGKQGARGLLSLGGSLLLIGFVLLPAILNGYSPVAVSIGVSSLIIILGSYVTHGFNRTTTSAVIGMILTILFVGVFASYSIGAAGLTGFESEVAAYLNFNLRGNLDLSGLLLGGILIGLLGVLYDAAISQAIAVEELHRVAPHLHRRTIYGRAIRIGREHIGALVDTLAIAYVGASLPLLLLFYASSESAAVIVNREIFSAEIVRTLVGSIGLILTVPVTTLISVWLLIKKTDGADQAIMEKEREAIEHAGHHH